MANQANLLIPRKSKKAKVQQIRTVKSVDLTDKEGVYLI